MAFNIGDAVPLVYTINAVATVVCTITDPDGIVTTPSTVQGGTPPAVTYSATVAATKAGLWKAHFAATGAVTDAEEQQFWVDAAGTATLYVTVGELRAQLADAGVELDRWLLERACVGTSRAIDQYCGRRFWRDVALAIRVYRPRDARTVRVDDIATATGLVVKTDTAGTGTYATTLAVGTDFQLEPFNADLDGVPWRKLVALGTGQPFPWNYARPTVQVTAKYGWPAVPEDVREAARLKAARLFRRKDSPDGLRGFGEFGVVRISRYEDPDVAMLLDPYALTAGSMVA
jgi:hypothetical protein